MGDKWIGDQTLKYQHSSLYIVHRKEALVSSVSLTPLNISFRRDLMSTSSITKYKHFYEFVINLSKSKKKVHHTFGNTHIWIKCLAIGANSCGLMDKLIITSGVDHVQFIEILIQ